MQIDLKKIGNELQPLLVIDNFHPTPLSLTKIASELTFIQDKSFYPGVRAPAPSSYAEFLAKTIRNVALAKFQQPGNVSSLASTFARVALAPEKLHLLQQMPHYDSNDPSQLACIHYLCDPDMKFGGTAFYRHISTGFEHINGSRLEQYNHKLLDEIDTYGIDNPPRYINTTNRMFTQIHSENPIFNRILIYRATSLHSGIIENDYLHDARPTQGRLTITSFAKIASPVPRSTVI